MLETKIVRNEGLASDEWRLARNAPPAEIDGQTSTDLAKEPAVRGFVQGSRELRRGIGRAGARAARAALVRGADCWRTGAERGLAGDFDEFVVDDFVGWLLFMILVEGS